MAVNSSHIRSLLAATSFPAMAFAANTAFADPDDNLILANEHDNGYLNTETIKLSAEEFGEQVMEIFRNRPINLQRLEELFQAGADPNFKIGDTPIGAIPLILNNQETFDLMITYGLEPDIRLIRHAIRENHPWGITSFTFDEDLIFHLDENGDNWLDILNQRADDNTDVSLARQALTLTGVITAINARIAKETAEIGMIRQGMITADVVAASIQRAEEEGKPPHEIPFFNAESLKTAIDEGNLELAELLLDRGISPNEPGFVTKLAAIHVVHSAESVELLSQYSANWLQTVITDVLDKEGPAILAVDRDESEVVEAILAREPNALQRNNNLIRRIEGFGTLDVIQQYGVLPPSELNDIDGRIVDARLREMVDGIGYDADALILATEAKRVDVPSVSFEKIASDFSIVPELPSNNEASQAVTLFVVEGQAGSSRDDVSDISHQLDTTRVARGVTARLGFENPDEVIIPLRHKFSSSILLGTSMPGELMDDPLRALLRSDAVQEGRIVFSYSMGAPSWSTPARDFEAFSNARPERNAQEQLGYWDQFNPIIFAAAGNNYDQGDFNQENWSYLHSARAMDVGSAVWHEDGYWSIPEYSDISGGGLLAPMTLKDGEVYEGTSFGAPYAGATYRGLAARHGFENGLGYDALTFAMLASTDRKVQAGAPFHREDWVEYTTNAAGMPFHPRAFSGVINPERADALATEIRQLQEEHGLADIPVRSRVDINIDHTNLNTTIGEEYVYRITAPSDVTLTRLALFLPQIPGAKSPITLESPSGYMITLPVADNGMVSTRALLAEDITEGAEFIIRTQTPLINAGEPDGQPFLVLRGLEPNNTVAHMRDVMLKDGRMLEPLSTVNASTITDQSVIVEEANAPSVEQRPQSSFSLNYGPN